MSSLFLSGFHRLSGAEPACAAPQIPSCIILHTNPRVRVKSMHANPPSHIRKFPFCAILSGFNSRVCHRFQSCLPTLFTSQRTDHGRNTIRGCNCALSKSLSILHKHGLPQPHLLLIPSSFPPLLAIYTRPPSPPTHHTITVA